MVQSLFSVKERGDMECNKITGVYKRRKPQATSLWKLLNITTCYFFQSEEEPDAGCKSVDVEVVKDIIVIKIPVQIAIGDKNITEIKAISHPPP